MNKSIRGFTLIEVVIVVAIIGLLASIAVPSYQEYIIRTNRADAKDRLSEVLYEQERFATRNRTYTLDMTDLGYSADPVPSTEGFYTIDAAVCSAGSLANCIVLTATPVGTGPQSGDGSLSINTRGAKLPADKWKK